MENLSAYRELLALDPDNEMFRAKVEHYEQKVEHGRRAHAASTQSSGSDATLTPAVAVKRLQGVGLHDSLGGGWHRSNYDPNLWVAILLKTFGPNEVSCLIESSAREELQLVELEAEFDRPGLHKKEVMVQFAKAVAALYPDAPKSLLMAIAEERSWENEEWGFGREQYGGVSGANGGYGLLLARK